MPVLTHAQRFTALLEEIAKQAARCERLRDRRKERAHNAETETDLMVHLAWATGYEREAETLRNLLKGA